MTKTLKFGLTFQQGDEPVDKIEFEANVPINGIPELVAEWEILKADIPKFKEIMEKANTPSAS